LAGGGLRSWGRRLAARFSLVCPSCGRRYGPSLGRWRCDCGSPLNIEKEVEGPVRLEGSGVWRYRPLLPLLGEPVSLGEGGTPLIERELLGVRALLKLEYLNPTGSFKDRGAAVMVSNLRAMGAGSVVIDSSGNAGVAVAAYCAAAGVRCRVYVPASAPRAKKLQILLHGAELVEVGGPRSEVARRALEAVEGGEVYASHMWSPLFIEGLKTIAYECSEQAGAPDAVVVPVGSGGLLLGLAWGFEEAARLGLADGVPRVIAVQAAGYTPLYDAIHGPYGARPPEEPLADGIAIPNPPRLPQLVEAVRGTGGDVVVVGEAEVLEALKQLARMGLLVEPTSATVLAALWRAVEERLVDAGERVLLPLTGSGLKALDKVARRAGLQ